MQQELNSPERVLFEGLIVFFFSFIYILQRLINIIRLNDLHISLYKDQLPRTLHGSYENDIYDMVK